MPSEVEAHSEIIRRVVQTRLGGAAKSIVDCSPGYSGSFVYAVDVVTPAGPLPCIVKLVPNWGNEEDWPDDVMVTNRVYGTLTTSFGAAYTLLEEHGVPLPRVYAALTPGEESDDYCFIMERLPGEDVDTVRVRLSGLELARLDALIGKQLGAIHSITRPFFGWVNQSTPFPESWRDTFFAAIHVVLDRCSAHTTIIKRHQEIMRTVERYAVTWLDPTQFVLAHSDGLQGLLVPDGSGWSLVGVVDVEDYCFSDPRFVLAVTELCLMNPPMADTFWETYRQRSEVEQSYVHFRPLFQLYVLLDWLSNVPPEQQERVDWLTRHIDRCCTVGG